jgi:pimeloyl-ACP methyl ester carboxylesterase
MTQQPTSTFRDGVVDHVRGTPVRMWLSDGDPARPVLLALHGWSDGSVVYGPIASALSETCDVIATDAPGHGQSTWTLPRRYSFDELVEPVLHVVDELPRLLGGGRRLVVMGHSMGALTAAGVAARRPQLAHLVLEEPPGRPTLPGVLRRRRDARWLRRLQDLDPADRAALTGHAEDWPADELRAWAQAKSDLDVAALGRQRGWGTPLHRLLGSVSCPTTLILGSGGETQTTARDEATLRAAATGPLRIERLAGGGHNPRRDAAAGFVAVLTTIMNRYA